MVFLGRPVLSIRRSSTIVGLRRRSVAVVNVISMPRRLTPGPDPGVLRSIDVVVGRRRRLVHQTAVSRALHACHVWLGRRLLVVGRRLTVVSLRSTLTGRRLGIQPTLLVVIGRLRFLGMGYRLVYLHQAVASVVVVRPMVTNRLVVLAHVRDHLLTVVVLVVICSTLLATVS